MFFLCRSLCLLFLLSASIVYAEVAAEAPGPAEGETVSHSTSSLSALESVRESIDLLESEIKETEKRLNDAKDSEKAAIADSLKDLMARQESLQSDFESIATGIDPSAYEGNLVEDFVLKNEVDALLEPIIAELKELTAKPREIEELRSDLSRWEKRLKTTDAALSNLDTLPTDEFSESLRIAVSGTREVWEIRKTQAKNRIQAISYQLEQAERTQPSFISTAREGLRSFYKSRGRNFVFCILAFFITFFGLRFLHQQIDRQFPWRKKEKRPFYLRLIDVGLNVFSFLGAVAAALITLYATGDWVLMGLAIILLLGIALAAKNALPKFYDQGRLLLNLGEIREGERVTYNGIPWKVERLSFYTILTNPALRGGLLRLPVNQLSGIISRPASEEGELWFPCHEGDWVLLPDEGLGRIIAQTPEYVHLVKLGGAKLMIPTVDFLAKSSENLSHGFRVSTVFGVDYDHQSDSTTKIPETMWAFITKELVGLIDEREKLISLKVEFASAGASSLDLAIIADFDGSMAPKYQMLKRALQKYAVECCNENGWTIPFAQITLHNAFPEPRKEVPAPKEEKPKLP
ncbi:MAG: hypothetical protein P1U68_09895 [Verrucomicrobiales bacterium]|nr:hypothetical protein [Verrucomicrobiales bacterium]